MKKYNIGYNIKENRKQFRMTQSQLAQAIGVTHAAISFWENGVNVPNVMDCIKIADTLHISLDELVGRSDYT